MWRLNVHLLLGVIFFILRSCYIFLSSCLKIIGKCYVGRDFFRYILILAWGQYGERLQVEIWDRQKFPTLKFLSPLLCMHRRALVCACDINIEKYIILISNCMLCDKEIG